MNISVEMPSNIALIKYMGKKAEGKNRPTNSSLSLTLPHLKTTVCLQANSEYDWQPLPSDYPIQLSANGKERFIRHAQFLSDQLNVSQKMTLMSGNNFPSDCGIASSASSFAALTEAYCQAFAPETSVEKRAWLSSQGSGSSCRSFLSGWVQWTDGGIQSRENPYGHLHHMVVLAGSQVKEVSSSEAHKRVATSLLFEGRVERAENRLQQFLKSMEERNWKQLFQIAWAEFWDMHSLFETSAPPFGYFTDETIYVLNGAKKLWRESGDGPVVTMDAGPNVHLLWRDDQLPMAGVFFQDFLEKRLSCLSNIPEIGFAKL